MKRKRGRAVYTFLREGRELLLADPETIYHALGCEECGLRTQALIALALVGWTEAEYVTAEMERRAGVDQG